MIPKNNSLKLMEQFNSAVNKIEEFDASLSNVKKEIESKISIINACNTYSAFLAENLNLGYVEPDSNTIIFGLTPNKIVGGDYDSYGQTIHSKYIKMPTNVFNFITETGPLYKDNAFIEFYHDEDEKDYKYEYCNMLKHEADKTKKDVFKTFSSNKFTFAVEVNIGNIIGETKFDTIELCPYLPGSFSIKSIRVYTISQYLSQGMLIPEREYNDTIERVGNIRLSFGEKIDLYRIEFDIEVNYSDNGYPFGLRHIYFLDTDSDVESSYVVLEVNTNRYIDSIGQNCKILTSKNVINTTADKYGIEYYLFYDNNILKTELTNPIARNITKFYAKIPLKEPMIGIKFEDIILR